MRPKRQYIDGYGPIKKTQEDFSKLSYSSENTPIKESQVDLDKSDTPPGYLPIQKTQLSFSESHTNSAEEKQDVGMSFEGLIFLLVIFTAGYFFGKI